LFLTYVTFCDNDQENHQPRKTKKKKRQNKQTKTKQNKTKQNKTKQTNNKQTNKLHLFLFTMKRKSLAPNKALIVEPSDCPI